MKKKPEVYSHFLRNAKNNFLASTRALHDVAPNLRREPEIKITSGRRRRPKLLLC